MGTDRSIRLLLVSDFYPPATGGLEAHVCRLATHLQQRGHQVTVVALGTRAPEDECSPVEVVRARTSLARLHLTYSDAGRPFPPPWSDPELSRTIEAVARRVGSQVIHAHGWSAMSAESAAGRLGLPLVVTLHDYGLLCPMRSLLRGSTTCGHLAGLRCARCPGSNQGLVRRVGLGTVISLRRPQRRSVSRFIAVSNAVSERHVLAGLTPAPEVISNFIDPPCFEPEPLPSELSVLFVGPDAAYKGLHLVEEAHRRLVQKGVKTRLHHVGGSASTESGEVRRFGRLTGADLAAAYQGATVVAISPLWEEPCPTVALEAMAAGRPVVAACIGGLPDLVNDGVTGLLVQPHSSSAMAAGLETVLSGPEVACSMGEAARKRALSFTSDAVVPRIEMVYRSAIGQGAA